MAQLELCSTDTAPPISTEALRQAAKAALRSCFGFTAFRGHQEAAVLAALNGQDCFVLMPTGGGKSLCYALPPLVKRGLAIVVSPLIALMQDQVAGFQERGIAADYLSSSRTEAERRGVYADLSTKGGRLPRTRLLYVTPELLSTDGFLDVMRGLYASGTLLMVAVDEAHCISAWGHDFRSSYRKLWLIRQELPRTPIVALTATASQRVQQDIMQQLRLRSPVVLRASFDRANIHIAVRYLDMQGGRSALCADPLPALVSMMQEEERGDGATIIYCHKRDTVDRVAAALTCQGVACAAYHAGLPDRVRARVLVDWQQRRITTIAATVAFGMGVDRADVRLVVHCNLPKSIEGYYQEMGRAGRDGQPARSIILYSTQDRQSLEYLYQQTAKEAREGRKHGGGGAAGSRQTVDPRDQLQAFGQVVEMCLSAHCRRATVLAHFGEGPQSHVRCCDVCDSPAAVAQSVRQLAMLGAQRRQRFAGGKHTLDFEASSGGSRLEFEHGRPAEGLDFDEEPGNKALQDSEEEAIEACSEDDVRALAAVAAKRARRVGGSVLVALERAEAEQRESGGGGSKARLLSKLEQGPSAAFASRRPASTADVTEFLRKNVVKQVGIALASNTALRAALASASLAAEEVAVALETWCFVSAISKAAYQQHATALLVQLRKARALSDVPQLAEIAGKQGAVTPAAAGEAPSAIAAVPTAESLLRQVSSADEQCAVAATSADAETVQQAVRLLNALAELHVTADLLRETGAGKRLARLQRHSVQLVATAAQQAVAKWRSKV